jgi:hypothetical protein
VLLMMLITHNRSSVHWELVSSVVGGDFWLSVVSWLGLFLWLLWSVLLCFCVLSVFVLHCVVVAVEDPEGYISTY